MSPPEAGQEPAGLARATMRALTDGSDVFEVFFDKTVIGLALADLSTRFVRVNAAYARLLSRPPEDLIGLAFGDLLTGDERLGRVCGSAAVQAEMSYVGPDGQTRWVLHGVTMVPDDHGQPAWYAVSAQDITERRAAEQELRSLTATLAERAVRDPLTGLANRSLLEERLRAALSRDARTGTSTGVLFLDLDGFKAINDRHGHAVGDAVLRAVAARLREALRPGDTVGRLGGDEFVVLVETTTSAALEVLRDRLEYAVAAELAIDGLQLDVGVSVGVSMASGGDVDPAHLLDQADTAMYTAKRARAGAGPGRGRPDRPCRPRHGA